MSKQSKFYSDLKVKYLKGSEAEITAKIPSEIIEEHRTNILEEMRKDFVSPGFRKGNVPMNVFLPNVNEMRILEEAAELALNQAYPEIVKDEDIKVFGRPKITLTKLAPKNPVEFSINVGVIPEVKLPNYKKIAEKIVSESEPVSVSDAELEEVLKQLKSMRATKDDGSKTGSEADQELTDEYVKSLGNFKDVADFKIKIKENLAKEKENAVWQKKREKILKNLADESKLELPKIVVEDEARNIAERFERNLAERNMTKEDYLQKLGKTEADIRREDLAHVENELRIRLILDKIAELENIEVSDDEVEREMTYMTSRHPEADPAHLRTYIESILRNEKLLRFLEGRPVSPAAHHGHDHAGDDHAGHDHSGHSR